MKPLNHNESWRGETQEERGVIVWRAFLAGLKKVIYFPVKSHLMLTLVVSQKKI